MPHTLKLRASYISLHGYKNLVVIAVLTILPLLLVMVLPSPAQAAINQTINFQSKIVNKSTGLNLVAGSPACVKDGSANDTCDFQVRIWNHISDTSTTSGSGNLMFTQTFQDVEIGEMNGLFNLVINSCGSAPSGNSQWGTTTGTCTVVDDSDADSDPGVNFNRSDLYIEVSFAPSDTPGTLGSFTEVFTRLPLTSVPSAFHAQNASALGGLGADGFVQLSPNSVQTTGDTGNPLIWLNENGSGTPNLIQLQVGGTDTFIVTNNGSMGLGVASPQAFLDIQATTTASAQINFTPSGGTDPSSPVNGDLWYNGTELLFYDGTDIIDLLAVRMLAEENLHLGASIDTTGEGDITITFGGDNPQTISWSATHDAFTFSASILPSLAPEYTDVTQLSTAVVSSTIGQYTDIAIGSDGLPVISYYDINAEELKVIHCGDDACSDGNTVTSISTEDNIGRYSDIEIGINGLPVVAFQDVTNENIGILFCGNLACDDDNDLVWHTDSDALGEGIALAIGSDGRPLVAYANATDETLNLLYCEDVECGSMDTNLISTDLDSDFLSDSSVAIEIGLDGNPFIAFHNNIDFSLDWVRCEDPICDSFVPGTSGNDTNGRFVKMTLDIEGRPLMVSQGASTNIEVTHCDNIACTTATSTNLISVLSIRFGVAINNDGLPVIIYNNASTQTTSVAVCADSSCNELLSEREINSTENTGSFPSIEIPADGRPVLSFFDGATLQLRVVKCATSTCNAEDGYDYVGGVDLGSSTNFFNNIYGVTLHAQDLAVNNFDVAEEYYVEDLSISAGDVVRFKQDSDNQLVVERTREAQDAGAIGVISTQPGLYLKDWQKNVEYGRPVALAGRVPVKVTNENGPVKRGDFLTPASTPGYAMKADRGGVIIGRAMEDFDPEFNTEEGDSKLVNAILGAASEQAGEVIAELLESGEISEQMAQEFVEGYNSQVAAELDLESENQIIKDELLNGRSAEEQSEQKEPAQVKYKKGRIMMFVDLGFVADEQFGATRESVVRSFSVNYFSLANGDNLFDIIDNPDRPVMILNVAQLVVAGSIEVQGDLNVAGYITASGASVNSLEVKSKLNLGSGENSISGSVQLPAGTTSIVVNNTQVTADSAIHLTSNQFANHRVTNIVPGQSFTIEVATPLTELATFNFLIIN